GAVLERADHPPQRPVEHLPGDRLEDPAAKGEVHAEIEESAVLPVGPEFPRLVEIFEWALDIVDFDLVRPALVHLRGEGLLECAEADDEIGDRLDLAEIGRAS